MKLIHYLIAAVTLLSGVAARASQPALVRLSVVSMRAAASHASEQVSQALMGTEVEVLKEKEGWSYCQTPDGYRGWIINHSLTRATPLDQWRKGPLMLVTSPYELHDPDRRTDLVGGDLLLALGDSLLLPDGRRIYLAPEHYAPLDSLRAQPFRPEALPEFAKQYLGVPYLWGGLSSKGMDCSGLVRMALWAQGRLLPRDAHQQALCGREVHPDSLRPGDLLFFGKKRVTHVAIYAGQGLYVHASQLVRINSLDPASPLYLALPIRARRRL